MFDWLRKILLFRKELVFFKEYKEALRQEREKLPKNATQSQKEWAVLVACERVYPLYVQLFGNLQK